MKSPEDAAASFRIARRGAPEGRMSLRPATQSGTSALVSVGAAIHRCWIVKESG